MVVMQEPGTSMTSTGDVIVENDLSEADFEFRGGSRRGSGGWIARTRAGEPPPER